LPYLVMEFIPGETLQQRLDRVGPLDVPEVLRIGRQIAEGLAAAHASDLIHRDIKPGNILLEGGAQKVKITDFGLARAADDASISQSGIIAGTPMFMSPEQALGHKIDQRADLFSLGSVLYQMASGRPPFRAPSTLAVLKRVAEESPRPIPEIIPETPAWLCEIITKLHAKDPDDRYQSAREVADVLADCEAQLKAHAKVKDFSRIPRGKPQRPRRWKWAVAAALVLLGLIGIGVAAWKLPGSNPPAGRTDPPADPATANDLPLAADSPTDLIPFARPDLSRGRWESQDGKLVHPPRDSDGYPGLTLAVRGPDDFDLEAEFERTSGDDFIAFAMSSRGHRFAVALDTWGKWAGVQDVAGELSNANPTRRMGPWLTTGRRHTFRCEVRASGVRAWLDAREVVDYRGGYNVLAYSPPNVPDWAQFFVQGNDNCGFVVHKLVLIPRPPGPPHANQDPLLAVAPFDAAQAKKHQEAWDKHLGVDVESTNSVGMKLVLIPPGQFLMGSPDDEPQREAHEGPQHEVVITRPFYLGAHDVTVGQFKAFVEAKGYKTEAEKGGGAWRPFPDRWWKQDPQVNWQNPGFEQSDDHPVVCVSWNDAKAFCDWLSGREGKKYTLPTEAQWEYACRAGSSTRFSFGDEEQELDQYAWYDANSKGKPNPVGQKKPNAWGLYDLGGNVWQWTADWYTAHYYLKSLKEDPPGPRSGTVHVLRGGCWWDGARKSRAGNRYGEEFWLPWKGSTAIGFRVVQVGDLRTKTPPPAFAPFTDADIKRIAALPAEEQVMEVRKELKRRNPGFDGKMEHKIEGGVVTEFRIVTDKVTDIAPIRVWSALRVLECSGTYTDEPNGLLADLTPLKGMNLAGLTHLNLIQTKVTDAGLVYFKGCKDLRYLNLNHTKVTDGGLAHFKDCQDLTILDLNNTKVTDRGLAHFKDCRALTHLLLGRTKVSDAGLANFKGMPLSLLWIEQTGITDLTPLQGMPLEDIRLTPKDITKGLDILRGITSLKTIGIDWNQSWPAAEFWERYDKGEFKE